MKGGGAPSSNQDEETEGPHVSGLQGVPEARKSPRRIVPEHLVGFLASIRLVIIVTTRRCLDVHPRTDYFSAKFIQDPSRSEILGV